MKNGMQANNCLKNIEIQSNPELLTSLDIVVFANMPETVSCYAKWIGWTSQTSWINIDFCLLDQNPEDTKKIISNLSKLGFDQRRIHVLNDDGIINPDLYVDPVEGGIGAKGAYAVPNLGDKHFYLFDNLSITRDGEVVKNKFYGLTRLLAGIPRDRGLSVLFDEGSDRICFAKHCIMTLSGKYRDKLIREVIEGKD